LLSASLRWFFARLPGAKKPVLMPRLPARVATACVKSPRRWRYGSGSGVLRTPFDVRRLPRPPKKPAKMVSGQVALCLSALAVGCDGVT
jgi:hypothetical protein